MADDQEIYGDDDVSSKHRVEGRFISQLKNAPPTTSKNDFSNSRSGFSSVPVLPSEKTLLEEIREVLPQSYLIFLLADLRLMSGTGRIKTGYESLVVDSDVYDRSCAAQLACNVEPQIMGGNEDESTSNSRSPYDVVSKAPEGNTKSLAPAQIMALLILELAGTFVDVTRGDDRKQEPPSFSDFKAYRHDGKTRRTLEDSMESLMRAYARMMSDDLVGEVPSVRKRRESMAMNPHTAPGIAYSATTAQQRPAISRGHHDPSLISVLRGFQERDAEEEADNGRKKPLLDIDEEKTDGGLNAVRGDETSDIAGGAASRPPVALSASTTSTRLFFGSGRDHQFLNQLNPLSPEYRRQVAETMASTRKNVAQGINDRVETLLPANREANTQKEFQELANALFEEGQSNPNVMSSMGGTYSATEMIRMMRKLVKSRDDAGVQFMSRLFKEGSVSQLMAESNSRIVWMNDWYPLKDLTYAIAVDSHQKRVLVVFRGAISSADWETIFKYSLESIENPVKDDFEGRKEKLRVFSGIYQYLFRTRKDTGTTKYSEIANLAHKYGREKIGEDYNLFVTGHSLGGALTMFFSFFASTEERFTRNGPVRGITFGSPYVGGHSFADTFRHQERVGRLQVVRVLNNNDAVPHLPLNFRIGRRGCLWRHNGIGVTLPPIPWLRKWKPRLQYIGKERSWIRSTLQGLKNNLFLNLPWFQLWNMARMHTLFELQDRLMYGILQSKPGGEFDLLKQTIDQLYEGLQENDFKRLKRPSKD